MDGDCDLCCRDRQSIAHLPPAPTAICEPVSLSGIRVMPFGNEEQSEQRCQARQSELLDTLEGSLWAAVSAKTCFETIPLVSCGRPTNSELSAATTTEADDKATRTAIVILSPANMTRNGHVLRISLFLTSAAAADGTGDANTDPFQLNVLYVAYT